MKPYHEQDRLDPVVEAIVQHLMSDTEAGKALHVLALEVVHLSDLEFIRLSEEDDNNWRVQLYWSTVSNLYMKALARAADSMVHYSDLERVPFYKTFKHVSEIFQTRNLNDKYHLTYVVTNGVKRHQHCVLRKIDGVRNTLTFEITNDVVALATLGRLESTFEVHCSQIVRAINNGRHVSDADDRRAWDSYENGEKE